MPATYQLSRVFKRDVLRGLHNFDTGGSVFRLALYTDTAPLSVSTPAYIVEGEVVSPNYTAGGRLVVQTPPQLNAEGWGICTFQQCVFPAVTLIARYALIYNASHAWLPAVGFLDFGENRQSSGGNFVVDFPLIDAPQTPITIR
jgi:hypothetical protein